MPNVLTRKARDYLLRVVKAARIEARVDVDPVFLRDVPFGPRYFARNGKPISAGRWAGILESLPEYVRVRSTPLPGDRLVSTIWLGMDASHHASRRLIFETVVFGPATTSLSFGRPYPTRATLDQERYETEAEAIMGHAELVEKWSGPVPTQAAAEA